MSAQGILPTACPRGAAGVARVRYAALVVLALAAGGCASDPRPHLVMSERSQDGRHHAEVRLIRCGTEWCHSLWTGPAGDSLRLLATLPHDTERAAEVAWTPDGGRVAFLINGQQLRIYDAQTGAPAGLLDLVPGDGTPSSRIARGVTFSENGRALTFDDCPRNRSGCRPGLAALR